MTDIPRKNSSATEACAPYGVAEADMLVGDEAENSLGEQLGVDALAALHDQDIVGVFRDSIVLHAEYACGGVARWGHARCREDRARARHVQKGQSTPCAERT